MKAKHTPGPWAPAIYQVTDTMLERMKVGSFHHAVCTNNDLSASKELLVALCGDDEGFDSQSAADARLIAAAPEMLAMLKQLRDLLQNETGLDTRIWEDTAQELLDVIAQAEGDES